MVQVCINGLKGKMEADSCSTANIMEEHKFEKLQSALEDKKSLQTANTQLHAFAQKEPVPLIGCFNAEIEGVSTGKKTVTRFLVAKGITKSPPLLSLDTRINLGLLHVNNTIQEEAKQPAESCTGTLPTDSVMSTLISEYHDVFSGLGKHKHIKAKLIVDESIQPVAHRQRRIPYNLAQKAAHEELRLREQGVMETVPNNQPTTWCTNRVIALRVPNTAILRPVKEALTVKGIKFKLNDATVVSFLDMNEGYHQLELDESSRHMNTFYGTECNMRYTRMNYGIISAQDIVDKEMDDTRHPR